MLIIDPNYYPEIPLELFQCPICGAQIYIQEIDEWETETGKITDCGLDISCTTEPEFDDDQWHDWFSGHFSMPYVDWLPLEVKVLAWLNRHYRMPTT